jgi:hypothetical protein
MSDVKYGAPTAEQLAKINRLTKRPFAADEVFVNPAKMVGDAVVPNRFMRLHSELLNEFVRQANGGNVAFMMNHRWSSMFGLANNKGPMNIGRVFNSWMANSHDLPDETMAQFGEVYIPRGKEKDGVKTDEVIDSIEDGTQFDVSVGFGFNKAECSICSKDIRDKQSEEGCKHYPGKSYDGQLCIVVAKPPGDQFELSGVYAGAYPSAGMLGADHTDSASNVEEVVYAEDLVRVEMGARIVGAYGRGSMNLWVPKDAIKQASFLIGSKPDEGGDGVTEWDKFGAEAEKRGLTAAQATVVLSRAVEEAEKYGLTAEQASDVLSKVAELSTKRGVGVVELAASLDDVTATFVTPAVALGVVVPTEAMKAALGKEFDQASVLLFAKDGLAVREAVIDECVKMRVRASGNAFDADAYKETLHKTGFAIAELRDMTEGFRTAAGEALSPGRQTVPAERKDDKPKSHVPAEAFMVRK